MTLNGLADVPLTNSEVIKINPAASDPVNLALVNLTLMSAVVICSAFTNNYDE